MTTLLVTGAAGKLGHRVVDLLLTQGYKGKVIAGSRDTAKLADLTARGAEARTVDFDDAAGLAKAFAGVDRLLIISTDALGEPGKRGRQHTAAVKAAKAAGVKHIVYTSMPNPEPGSAVTFAPDHYDTEQAIKASGLGYTILRNTWYADNLLGNLPQQLGMGKWFTSAAEGKTAHVTREDCARVAAAVLASDKAEKVTHTITGPSLHTNAEIAALASAASGRPLEVVHVDDAGLAGGLKQAGLPDFIVDLIVGFDINTRKGGTDLVTDAVTTLTGKAPQDLKSFLEANRAVLKA